MMIVIGDDKDGGRLSSSYKEYEVSNILLILFSLTFS